MVKYKISELPFYLFEHHSQGAEVGLWQLLHNVLIIKGKVSARGFKNFKKVPGVEFFGKALST